MILYTPNFRRALTHKNTFWSPLNNLGPQDNHPWPSRPLLEKCLPFLLFYVKHHNETQ